VFDETVEQVNRVVRAKAVFHQPSEFASFPQGVILIPISWLCISEKPLSDGIMRGEHGEPQRTLYVTFTQ
jgi:hypothetical protein